MKNVNLKTIKLRNGRTLLYWKKIQWAAPGIKPFDRTARFDTHIHVTKNELTVKGFDSLPISW